MKIPAQIKCLTANTFNAVSNPKAYWRSLYRGLYSNDNVAVFCGSRIGNDPEYVRQAYLLGSGLITAGLNGVYGGGDVGLMGAFSAGAAEALKDVQATLADLRLISFNPIFFKKAQKGSNPFVFEKFVRNMSVRKEKFLETSQTFIHLPGGIGTLDELFEVLAAADVQVHEHPNRAVHQIILIDSNGFYSKLLKPLLDGTADAGFAVRDRLEKLVHIVPDADAAIQKALEIRKTPIMPCDLTAKINANDSDYRSVLRQLGFG